MNRAFFRHPPALALVLILLPGLAARADSPSTAGTRWEVTTSMNGMGMSLPSQVSQVCATGDKKERPGPPESKNSNCTSTLLSQTATAAKYAIKCTGKQPMEGTGEMVYGPGHYKGTFNLNAGQGQMTMTFEGNSKGPCTGSEANSPARTDAIKSQVAAQQNQYQSAMGQSCKIEAEGAANPYGFMDTFNSGAPRCADPALKQTYCAHFQGYIPFVAQRDSETAMARSGAAAGTPMTTPFSDSLKLCGLKADAVQTKLCSGAEGDNAFEFLVKECPAQMKTIAARECAGRSYTTVSARYRGICSSYATANAAGQQSGTQPDQPANLKDKAKSALKGLFGR